MAKEAGGRDPVRDIQERVREFEEKTGMKIFPSLCPPAKTLKTVSAGGYVDLRWFNTIEGHIGKTPEWGSPGQWFAGMQRYKIAMLLTGLITSPFVIDDYIMKIIVIAERAGWDRALRTDIIVREKFPGNLAIGMTLEELFTREISSGDLWEGAEPK
jgi:hypothetical protein